MDITSKLIYEAYKGGYEPANLDVVEFRRDITRHFVNDFFKFKDQKTKKHYNVFQVFEKVNKDKPGFLHSTSIFDCQMPEETAMMYHNMDRHFMKILPDYNLKHNSLPNKNKKLTAYEENVLLEIIEQVMDYDMKKRTVGAMGMKPETKEHFGDILGALNEAVENIIFKVTKVTKRSLEDDDIYILRITDKLSKKKYMVKQLIPVWSPHEKETEIYVMQPQLKGTGTHGQMVHSGMKLVATAYGPDIKNEIMQNMTRNNLTATPRIPGMKNKSRASQQDDSAEKELQQLGSFLNKLTVKELDKILYMQKMKPKTREHFGDILGSLSESKQNDEPEIMDFNRIYSNNPGYRYNKIIDEITVRYNTSKGVRFYEILQYFSYAEDEKTPMFLGLELKKKVLDKKTKRWETDLIPLRKHNQGGKPLTYIGGYELYDGLTNNTLEVDKDTFEVLKIALMSQKERLKILSTKNMKPKTKEHFEDIIGSL